MGSSDTRRPLDSIFLVPNPNPNQPAMFDPSHFSYHPPPLIPPEPATGSFPYFGSQPNWTPIGYDSATQAGNESALLGMDPNSFWAIQPPVVTSDCNTRDVCEKHSFGKNSLQASSNFANHITLPTHLGIAALPANKMNLLCSGAALDSVRVCTVCNVVCNSHDVFHKHMLGKKHALQASLAALGEVGPYIAAVRAQFEGSYKKAPKKVKIVQPAWCEVCQISCNSGDAYAAHITGKKHNHNLEELRRLSSGPTSASTYPVIGPEENPEANKGKSMVVKKASEEDMVAKRQKIVRAGTAAGLIRTCTVCNVVCNSLTVFNSHLGGQKHKDMLKKLQESGL